MKRRPTQTRKPPGQRQLRVGERIRHVLAAVLQRGELRDPVLADASTTVTSGTLESSNVNIASAMVNMIELARHFDMQVKALHTADEDSQSSTKLLQSSG